MKPGLYTVQFSSNKGVLGSGVATFDEHGRVSGGDHGYLYLGVCTVNGENLAADLTIVRHNPSVASIFGALDDFHLTLAGTATGDGFQLTGSPAEMRGATINITGVYREPLPVPGTPLESLL